jgi:hypothetical protein
MNSVKVIKLPSHCIWKFYWMQRMETYLCSGGQRRRRWRSGCFLLFPGVAPLSLGCSFSLRMMLCCSPVWVFLWVLLQFSPLVFGPKNPHLRLCPGLLLYRFTPQLLLPQFFLPLPVSFSVLAFLFVGFFTYSLLSSAFLFCSYVVIEFWD